MRRIRAGRHQMPIGVGTLLFSRIYVGDVATAVAAALEADTVAGEVFNIAETATAPYRLFAQQIIAAANHDLQLMQVPETLLPNDLELTRSESRHLLLDASKARRVLRWQGRNPAGADSAT